MANLLTTSLASESKHSMSQAFRSTRMLTSDGLMAATLLVEDERIVALRSWEDAPRDESLHDFGDQVLLPGLVDSHVHINDPGRADWEGFETATRAAAAGGVTTLVDMPLNCIPETTNVAALEDKRQPPADGMGGSGGMGRRRRGNADTLCDLANAGVPGFKCFLIDSGIHGFRGQTRRSCGWHSIVWSRPDCRCWYMPRLPAVDAATEKLCAAGADWRRYSTYLASRPDEAEIEAIRLLIRLAEEYKTHIHIVHLSSAQALPLLKEARARGAR